MTRRKYKKSIRIHHTSTAHTEQTALSACSVYNVVNISGTAESGYTCIETNTMSQARRPFTLENLWFHNTHNVFTSNRIQDPNDPCQYKHHYEPVSSKISGIVLLPDMNSLCEVNNKHAFLKIEHLSPEY